LSLTFLDNIQFSFQSFGMSTNRYAPLTASLNSKLFWNQNSKSKLNSI